jgi:hypothetical protein
MDPFAATCQTAEDDWLSIFDSSNLSLDAGAFDLSSIFLPSLVDNDAEVALQDTTTTAPDSNIFEQLMLVNLPDISPSVCNNVFDALMSDDTLVTTAESTADGMSDGIDPVLCGAESCDVTVYEDGSTFNVPLVLPWNQLVVCFVSIISMRYSS